ncbi:MAG TPA: AAA family ATPase, partial [Candidatus Nanopelagicales bacterium]|nr:AAA family ATPase [Candidatus Nanopelagicales bacterium]
MDLRQFLERAAQTTAALSTIHQLGALHLDLRPENIVVDPDTGAVKLRGGQASTRSEQDLSDEPRLDPASLPYMAPEQTGRVDRAVDQRADLYALGITFYEMLSGKRPFEADDAPGWAHCHIARSPAPLAEVAPGVPAIITEIVMRLLAKAPEDRYQTAVGLEADLRLCLTEVEANGKIEPFPLGTSDIPDKLQLPSKLYGRDEERTTLLQAFERVVASGAAELVLVSGYSGIGKTSLVREVQEPIVRERGAFISGKFEQLQRDIPYRTVAQAFGELIRQILTESAESLAAWKRRLEAALGENGRLITDIVPQLALIIGEQPDVAPLGPAEAHARFVRVFQAFLGAVARKKHPLVLFVDDLQWSDPAGLRLLVDVLSSPEARYLLVIGAYRDNEVSPSHPLMEALKELRTAGARISRIRLGPLPGEHLLSLVRDTFRCDSRYAEPLSTLLAQKTGGNPFFVGQFLTELYRKKLIRVDALNCVWRWEIDEIAAQNLTDNVVDLVISRLRRLGPETQRALTLAACLGSRIGVDVLSNMLGQSPETTHAAIAPAIADGLMARRGRTYRFLHDRVQQAAYLLIPEEKRAEMHLRVGRLLLVQTPEDALEERLFEIANQLDIGASLITDPGERRRIAELNLRAGRKAKASGAYGSAVSYLSTGTSLLGDDAWTDEEDPLAYPLHLELAESSCLNGEFERAEQLAGLLLERAKTNIEKSAAYRVQMQVHTTRS